MTRDFSKQRRDDMRPSSRNSTSGRYGEERSPRPARPRPNRESADRAWENGAPQNHADYRGNRNNNNRYGQPARDSRRREFDQPSAQYSRNRPNNYGSHNSRPFDNRQDNYRQSEDAPYGNSNPRYRSNDYGVRDSGNPRFNDRRRRDYPDRAGETGSQRGFRDNRRYRDSDNRYQDRNEDRGNGYQERERGHNDRYPREFDRDNRSPRNFNRNNRPYPPRDVRGANTQNPRWQSRPPVQRGNAYSRSGQDSQRYRPQEEQFEGDYERFDTPAPSQHPRGTGRFQDNPSDRYDQVANEPPERTVTRLPDGRVLKGPRPVQRKNAQFWHEIADETEALVDQVHTLPAEQPADLPEAAPAKQKKPKASPQPPTTATPRTPRKRVASTVARGKKAGTRETGTKKAPKARSTGPKPSQRGFKWPTQE